MIEAIKTNNKKELKLFITEEELEFLKVKALELGVILNKKVPISKTVRLLIKLNSEKVLKELEHDV